MYIVVCYFSLIIFSTIELTLFSVSRAVLSINEQHMKYVLCFPSKITFEKKNKVFAGKVSIHTGEQLCQDLI